MKFTVYNNAEDFRQDCLDILMENEIQNNILLKNISDKAFLASVKDENGEVILVANKWEQLPLVVYEKQNTHNEKATEFFASSLYQNKIDINIIMTEPRLALDFCRYYNELTKTNYKLVEELALCTLEKVNKTSMPSGYLKQVDITDMYYLPYWLADFLPACGLGEYNINNGVASAEHRINCQNGYVWIDKTPVSLASNTRNISDCAIIAQVYTPHKYRGKGYAAACVASVSQIMLDKGYKKCALYVNCANPPALKAYSKVGYKELFRYNKYEFSKE